MTLVLYDQSNYAPSCSHIELPTSYHRFDRLRPPLRKFLRFICSHLANQSWATTSSASSLNQPYFTLLNAEYALSVFEDPVECGRNGHVYCRGCAKKCKQCPSCQVPFGFVGGTWIERQVSNLKAKCQYKDKGCQYASSLENVLAHEKGQLPNDSCDHALTCCRGCNEAFERRRLADHEMECQEMEIGCDNTGCTQMYKRKNRKIHIGSICQFVRCQRVIEWQEYQFLYKWQCEFRGPQSHFIEHNLGACGSLVMHVFEYGEEVKELRAQVEQLQADLAKTKNAYQWLLSACATFSKKWNEIAASLVDATAFRDQVIRLKEDSVEAFKWRQEEERKRQEQEQSSAEDAWSDCSEFAE